MRMQTAQDLAPDHARHGGVGGEGRAARHFVHAVGTNGALADPLVVGDDVHRAASRISAAASSTARTILSYPVHRQRLPASQKRTSSSVGSGFFFNSASEATSMPEVQMPHWSAACSRNFCCSGCSFSPCAMPSMVLISWPSASAASIRQEQTRRPSTVMLQAPQSPDAQPSLEPVSPSGPRSASSMVSLGSHRYSIGSPLIVVVTWIL